MIVDFLPSLQKNPFIIGPTQIRPFSDFALKCRQCITYDNNIARRGTHQIQIVRVRLWTKICTMQFF
jgi:hypothetical protein